MFSWFTKLFRQAPPASAAMLGRNDLCWCGSGKKYKKCHHDLDQAYFASKARNSCTASS